MFSIDACFWDFFHFLFHFWTTLKWIMIRQIVRVLAVSESETLALYIDHWLKVWTYRYPDLHHWSFCTKHIFWLSTISFCNPRKHAQQWKVKTFEQCHKRRFGETEGWEQLGCSQGQICGNNFLQCWLASGNPLNFWLHKKYAW